MAARLRVYQSPDDTVCDEQSEPTVRVSLGELLPLVALAHRRNYLRLQDLPPTLTLSTKTLFCYSSSPPLVSSHASPLSDSSGRLIDALEPTTLCFLWS